MKKDKLYTYNKVVCFIGVCLAVMLFPFAKLQAQQDSQFTQYMYNTQTVNPAYAGTRGVTSLTALYRAQWIGLEGAPKTFNFTGSTPLGDMEHIGLGFAFIKDQIGPADESTIAADFSYTIQLNDFDTKLAFGLKGGINLLNVDYSLLNIYNPSDLLFQQNIDNRVTPIIGAGVYLYDENWYTGISVPNILESTHYNDVTVSNASEKANLYVIGGYVFDIGRETKFKPAVLGKFVSGAPAAIDLSANFLFNNVFTLGAAYRFDAALSGLAGFQLNENILIGYAYDYGVQDLTNYNSGSHEIFLRFEFGGKKLERLITPRFF